MSTRNIWPIAASGAAAVLKHSYVALAVDAASLAPLAAELQAILGEGYAELRGNRDARDGAGHYHLTALEPREFRTIVKQKRAAGSRLELPSGELPLELLGIGTAVSETSQSWFAVCRSEAVAAWRSALGLPAKDLHITLAFGAGGDVHGKPKGVGSLLTVRSIPRKESAMAVAIDPQLKGKLLDELLSGLQTDGGHHKQYYLEQAVKLLTDCPTVTVDATDYKGRPYSYEALGESEEFLEFKLAAIDPEEREAYLRAGYEPDEILAEAWDEVIG